MSGTAAAIVAQRIQAVASKRLGQFPSPLYERLLIRCAPRLEALLRRELLALGIMDEATEWTSRAGTIEFLAQQGAYQKICLMRFVNHFIAFVAFVCFISHIFCFYSRLADRVHLSLGNAMEQVK